MKEMEKNMMCVLLQRLLDKNLITPKIHDNARQQILDTFDSGGFFCYSEGDRKEEFHEMTEEAWSITPNSCSSPTQAGTLIQAKMRELVYPVWCLEEVDTLGVFDIVKKYISLVQSDGQTAHGVANELGRIARQRPSCGQNMQKLLSADNCQKGMLLYLERFENGKLIKLAQDIGATDHMLSDIKKLFTRLLCRNKSVLESKYLLKYLMAMILLVILRLI